MASSYTATDAHAYEHLMGRWSGRLAKELIAFAGVETGDRVLDVGCGTGSMALAPAARLNLRGSWVSISRTIISPLPRRVPRTRGWHFSPGLRLLWIYPPAASTTAFRCLLSTSCRIPSGPSRACAGSRVRAGVVAAAVWDFAGGLVYQRIFWDTAAALDPDAELARGRHFSSPLTRERELAAAFEVPSARCRAGLAGHSHGVLGIQRLLGTDRKCPGTGWRVCEAASAGPARNISRRPCDGPILRGGPMGLARWRRPHGRRAAWSRDPLQQGEAVMKLSARNQIKGKIVEVRKGATTAHVRIDIGNGVVITSSITNEAVEDLGLAAGDEAIAVIKASDVMVAK
jgi:molybdopterin-binding protein